MAEQFYFTYYEEDQKIRASSEDMSGTPAGVFFSTAVRYDLPQEGQRGRTAPEHAPVSLSFTIDKRNRVVIRKFLLGRAEGRPDAHFSHVIYKLPVDYTAREAIGLWRNDGLWSQGPTLPSNVTKLPSIDESQLRQDSLDISFLKQHAALENLAWLIKAYFLNLRTKRGIRICAPCETTAALIWGLVNVLPIDSIANLTFNTYDSDEPRIILSPDIETTITGTDRAYDNIVQQQKELPGEFFTNFIGLNIYTKKRTNISEKQINDLGDFLSSALYENTGELTRFIDRAGKRKAVDFKALYQTLEIHKYYETGEWSAEGIIAILSSIDFADESLSDAKFRLRLIEHVAYATDDWRVQLAKVLSEIGVIALKDNRSEVQLDLLKLGDEALKAAMQSISQNPDGCDKYLQIYVDGVAAYSFTNGLSEAYKRFLIDLSESTDKIIQFPWSAREPLLERWLLSGNALDDQVIRPWYQEVPVEDVVDLVKCKIAYEWKVSAVATALQRTSITEGIVRGIQEKQSGIVEDALIVISEISESHKVRQVLERLINFGWDRILLMVLICRHSTSLGSNLLTEYINKLDDKGDITILKRSLLNILEHEEFDPFAITNPLYRIWLLDYIEDNSWRFRISAQLARLRQGLSSRKDPNLENALEQLGDECISRLIAALGNLAEGNKPPWDIYIKDIAAVVYEKGEQQAYQKLLNQLNLDHVSRTSFSWLVRKSLLEKWSQYRSVLIAQDLRRWYQELEIANILDLINSNITQEWKTAAVAMALQKQDATTDIITALHRAMPGVIELAYDLILRAGSDYESMKQVFNRLTVSGWDPVKLTAITYKQNKALGTVLLNEYIQQMLLKNTTDDQKKISLGIMELQGLHRHAISSRPFRLLLLDFVEDSTWRTTARKLLTKLIQEANANKDTDTRNLLQQFGTECLSRLVERLMEAPGKVALLFAAYIDDFSNYLLQDGEAEAYEYLTMDVRILTAREESINWAVKRLLLEKWTRFNIELPAELRLWYQKVSNANIVDLLCSKVKQDWKVTAVSSTLLAEGLTKDTVRAIQDAKPGIVDQAFDNILRSSSDSHQISRIVDRLVSFGWARIDMIASVCRHGLPIGNILLTEFINQLNSKTNTKEIYETVLVLIERQEIYRAAISSSMVRRRLLEFIDDSASRSRISKLLAKIRNEASSSSDKKSLSALISLADESIYELAKKLCKVDHNRELSLDLYIYDIAAKLLPGGEPAAYQKLLHELSEIHNSHKLISWSTRIALLEKWAQFGRQWSDQELLRPFYEEVAARNVADLSSSKVPDAWKNAALVKSLLPHRVREWTEADLKKISDRNRFEKAICDAYRNINSTREVSTILEHLPALGFSNRVHLLFLITSQNVSLCNALLKEFVRDDATKVSILTSSEWQQFTFKNLESFSEINNYLTTYKSTLTIDKLRDRENVLLITTLANYFSDDEVVVAWSVMAELIGSMKIDNTLLTKLDRSLDTLSSAASDILVALVPSFIYKCSDSACFMSLVLIADKHRNGLNKPLYEFQRVHEYSEGWFISELLAAMASYVVRSDATKLFDQSLRLIGAAFEVTVSNQDIDQLNHYVTQIQKKYRTGRRDSYVGLVHELAVNSSNGLGEKWLSANAYVLSNIIHKARQQGSPFWSHNTSSKILRKLDSARISIRGKRWVYVFAPMVAFVLVLAYLIPTLIIKPVLPPSLTPIAVHTQNSIVITPFSTVHNTQTAVVTAVASPKPIATKNIPITASVFPTEVSTVSPQVPSTTVPIQTISTQSVTMTPSVEVITADYRNCNLVIGKDVKDIKIDDGDVISAGEKFTKIWRVTNTSNCDWGPGFTLVFDKNKPSFVAVNTRYPNTWFGGDVSSKPLGEIRSGQSFTVSVELIAPSSSGRFGSAWKFQSPDGMTTDTHIWVIITVK